MHPVQQPFAWAAQYNTWLLIKLTPKGIVFSFMFFFFSSLLEAEQLPWSLQVRMLLPRRQLKPRTFRASADQTVFLGGLARIDVVQIPAQTIYLTVWASDEVSCHYGRTDKADDR